MKRRMRVFWNFVLPAVLAAAAVWALAEALLRYEAHMDAGFGAQVPALVCGLCALIAAIRRYRAENWTSFAAYAALLGLCVVCFGIAAQIPNCPMCDGISPLMRHLLPEWAEH